MTETLAARTEAIRLLYIDDDRGLSRLVEKELGRHGYAVTCAPDGDAGLGTLVARPGCGITPHSSVASLGRAVDLRREALEELQPAGDGIGKRRAERPDRGIRPG